MMQGHAQRRLRLLAVLVSHVILPVWFVWLLATLGREDTATWIVLLISAATYVAYIAIAGSWSWFGVYAQRALPVLMVAGAFISRPRFLAINASPQMAEIRLVSIALALVFLILTVRALFGRWVKAEAQKLFFPLRNGTYIVAQGGRTRTINRHARNKSRRYALEIVKLGNLGLRASGLYPVSLKKYAIFGEEVVSPCDGVVVAASDSLPDRIPPDRDQQNVEGNYVAIESGDAVIYLSNLMKGSLMVDPGRRVRAGQVLGRVGNSGDSTEPHLHIHVQKAGAGMPMRFGGRFLVRNDCVDAPR